jgi:hypothetical protein
MVRAEMAKKLLPIYAALYEAINIAEVVNTSVS